MNIQVEIWTLRSVDIQVFGGVISLITIWEGANSSEEGVYDLVQSADQYNAEIPGTSVTSQICRR